ncbi:MAG: TetR/AcrR family transcriptional regulator [Tractidigestivibacter sp.]|jgi:AcrR family transcriptional regulator|uniref:TetR/AcrR family transcriptional regulator n=1 Tax=Tractidigestivibacter sp. TaxID=2847320 RepID=UPI003D8FADA7
MDRRREANARARSSIENALMELLQTKNYSSITVTDIVRKAGVARATYYRNYGSIEDIMVSMLAGVRSQILEDVGLKTDQIEKSQLSTDVLEVFVRHYRLRRREILSLHNNGFSPSLLQLMADFAAESIGDMPANSIRHYDVYALPSAMYGTLIRWLEAGCPESDREMASYLSHLAANVLA